MAGIAGGGDMKRMGRIGAKAILYFEIVTTLALFLGLGAVNLVRPGRWRSHPRAPPPKPSCRSPRPPSPPCWNISFPASIIDAMARNDVLQMVVFAFLFGAACAAIGAKAAPVVAFCESLAEVMFRYTKYVMYLAPLGVGARHRGHRGQQGHRRAVRLEQADRSPCTRRPLLFIVLVLAPALSYLAIPAGGF